MAGYAEIFEHGYVDARRLGLKHSDAVRISVAAVPQHIAVRRGKSQTVVGGETVHDDTLKAAFLLWCKEGLRLTPSDADRLW